MCRPCNVYLSVTLWVRATCNDVTSEFRPFSTPASNFSLLSSLFNVLPIDGPFPVLNFHVTIKYLMTPVDIVLSCTPHHLLILIRPRVPRLSDTLILTYFPQWSNSDWNEVTKKLIGLTNMIKILSYVIKKRVWKVREFESKMHISSDQVKQLF